MEALVLHAEDLAKGWLLALLEQLPLQRAPAILQGALAQEAPRLCTGIVRALAEDRALLELQPGGELAELAARAGGMAGALGMQESLGAVEALAAVIWSAVRAALPDPDADQVSALAERLALVMELVRGAVLCQEPERVRAPEPEAQGAFAPEPEATLTPEPDTAPEHAWRGRGPEPSGDEALWKRALREEVAHSGRSGVPLSLLLIELEDAQRVRAAESHEEARATTGRFLQAVRTVVRHQDILAQETDTRIWVIARDTGRSGAQALGERAVAAVHSAVPWRGAPLAISVGFAVWSEGADDVEGLVAGAEEACLLASASGTGVAGYAAVSLEG